MDCRMSVVRYYSKPYTILLRDAYCHVVLLDLDVGLCNLLMCSKMKLTTVVNLHVRHPNRGNASASPAQLSIAFNFFVHGESTVCATIDVKQHQPIFQLTKNCFLTAQGPQNGLNVILSPYGLSGFLTGQSYKDSDPVVQRLLKEWKKFYPVNFNEKDIQHTTKRQHQMQLTSFHVECSDEAPLNNASSGAFPAVVEVVVAGIKMKYPSCYTYVTSDARRKLKSEVKMVAKSVKQTGNQECVTSTSSPRTTTDTFNDENECKLRTPALSPRQPHVASPTYRIRSSACQEININRQNQKDTTQSSATSGSSPCEDISVLARWDFSDPCLKTNCSCYRCKSKKQNLNSTKASNISSNIQNSNCGVNKKLEKNEKDKVHKNLKVSTPFHKRIVSDDLMCEVDSLLHDRESSECVSAVSIGSVSAQSSQQPKTPSCQVYKSPLGQASLPSIQSNATTPGGTAVDSPRSVAPLVNSEGPASYGVFESNLSSVSPGTAKDESSGQLESTVGTPNASKERSHLEQLLSPYHSVSSVKGVNLNPPEDSPSTTQWANAQGTNESESISGAGGQSCSITKSEPTMHTHPLISQMNGFKRPLLPANPLEESTQQRNCYLYDFTCTNVLTANWDLPPPKNRRVMNFTDSNNYGMKKDSVIDSTLDMMHNKPKDPYEFSEFDEDCAAFKESNEEGTRNEVLIVNSAEAALNNGAATPQTIKDSVKQNVTGDVSTMSPQTPVVFTRDEDLIVSYRDLEQIFDTSSGEESNDERFQAPSAPPNSSKGVVSHVNATDDSIKGSKSGSGNNANSSSGILGVAELTRMFPTPPSLEHNTAPSPCNFFAGTDPTLIDDVSVREKLDIYPSSPSLLETSKDWSYVYKPPLQSHCITSSKYGPLQNIPIVPAVQLPPECNYKPSSSQCLQNSAKSFQQSSQHCNTQPPGYFHHQPGTGIHNVNNQTLHSHQLQRMPLQSHFSVAACPPTVATNGGVVGGRIMRHPSTMRPVPPQMHFVNTQQSYAAHYPACIGGERHAQNSATCSPQFPPVPYQVEAPLHQGSTHMYSSYHSYHSSPHHGHSTPPINGNSSSLPPLSYDIQSQQGSYLSTRSSLQDSNVTNLEAHSLLVNLVLSDSMLNLFKDHNFESCALCVCNTNIRGSDVGVYLPDMLLPSGSEELQCKCICGFSAVSYRHRSAFAGLFYEDEIEITGVVYDPTEGRKRKSLSLVESLNKSEDISEKECAKSDNSLIDCDQPNSTLIDLLKSQCSTIFSSSSLLRKASVYESIKKNNNNVQSSGIPVMLNSTRVVTKNTFLMRSDSLLRSDSCEIAFMALISGKQAIDGHPSKLMLQQYNTSDRINIKASTLHEWPFSNGGVPSNNYQVIRLLRNLQPLLQEAVQKKPQAMWEVTYTVSGPLTWRQFHRLAGRGTDDQCEPQPIPSLLVGHDKDWMALSPFGLKYWEKLLLEPYSVTKDIAYIVVAPDNGYILSHVKSYFKELSTTYEMLRLGKHCPIAKVLRDGIMRVGKTTAKNLADKPVDEWFNQIGDGNVASKLKMYAQACRHYVTPLLTAQSLEKLLCENFSSRPLESTSNVSTSNSTLPKIISSSPVASESASVHESKSNTEESTESVNISTSASQQPTDSVEQDDDPNKQAAVVIYIVEPFTFANMDDELYRLSCLGLMRCYIQMLKYIPEQMQSHIHLQLVSLDAVLGLGKDFLGSKRQDQLKSLAISVFNQCRKIVSNQSISKSLTGFGPAASLDIFLKNKEMNTARIYTPPYILAPLKDKQTELVEISGDRREKSQTLFCAYCLSEDQRWLIVSCCNDKGDLLESTCINIEVPNRTRRKKASVKKFGLHKVMEFVLSVIAETLQPWRLIIGRLGRVGHGELREWAYLLSKKSLLRYSRHLREKCRQCSFMAPYDIPCIFSACLISLEADTSLRVFPDQFTPDDRFSNNSNNCQLSTPEDASCTHILVFPTSATTQSSQGTFPIDPLGPNIGEDDLLQALGADGDELGVDDGINDIFGWPESPPVSPGVGSPRGPVPHLDKLDSTAACIIRQNSSVIGGDSTEEPPQLQQQPLALGYYVSTAQTGPLPKWFWSSCSHLENICPSALLIHTPSVQQSSDDLYSNTRSNHPLDSDFTTDVLRYVLEGYNSLSWINLDPSTHDRMSCLPVHIQILMQLYHTVQALI
ncbi:Mediator of RNA polymerase II transcription subunit 13-like protein [Leptotrombidium deliense]|uniref:Mediator of RNA polymerase II transcription subunit 13 n=1 Tax=Leptotrombidium deliense TaxID=299467 RepID=A0A443SLP6_9ACAR|nr:Mediator of RNA polymerase II transcription subunit 13-like protein [Leptotrombidium deliense]